MKASNYFKYLYLGVKVQDEGDGDIGYITELIDIHNVFVTFPVQSSIKYEDLVPNDFNGTGLYCLDQSCTDYYDLTIIDEDFINKIRENKLKRVV